LLKVIDLMGTGSPPPARDNGSEDLVTVGHDPVEVLGWPSEETASLLDWHCGGRPTARPSS